MQAEREWLQWLRRQAEKLPARSGLRLGIGDDAALLAPRRGWELAITTDLMIEDVHFLRRRDPAIACGRRLATRALSDLAAMGAEPLALFVSSAFPAKLPTAWPRQLIHGLLAAAAEANARLAGGDVSASPVGKIMLDVVGVGQVPAGKALRRGSAHPGDRIFVSGRLGKSVQGRELANQDPARWQLGIALRKRATTASSAAIDISDGLATDLHHLCRASRVGAEIIAASIPNASTLDRALFGGEDYELLFTLPPRTPPPRGFDVSEIGVIRPGRSLHLILPNGRRQSIPNAGWQHWQ